MDRVRKLFDRRAKEGVPPVPPEQEPIQPPALPPKPGPDHRPSQHDLQVGFASDPGRVRGRNEDTSFAWQMMIAQQGDPPLPTGIYIIADGMGGHALGDEASALATNLVAEHIIRKITLPMLGDRPDTSPREPIHDVLRQSVSIAHQAVSRRYPMAGTTMTLALMLGESVFVAHVGDSRAYLGTPGSFELLTQDHSVGARLVEMGQASEEEASAQRSVLYKAIGQGAEIDPDISYHTFGWGQYLLLCCDGLWGKVADEEIAAIVEAAPTPDAACQNLVNQANENGGEDNISVILVARGWPLTTRESQGPRLPQPDNAI